MIFVCKDSKKGEKGIRIFFVKWLKNDRSPCVFFLATQKRMYSTGIKLSHYERVETSSRSCGDLVTNVMR